MYSEDPNTSVRQLSFEFAGNAGAGLALWREQQRAVLRRLGSELGLPVGSVCEVVLTSGIQLRGCLVFDEADLFPSATRTDAMLRIGSVSFSFKEIDGCVRIV